MQPLHMYLYLTFVAHSYGKRYNLMQKYEKKSYLSNNQIEKNQRWFLFFLKHTFTNTINYRLWLPKFIFQSIFFQFIVSCVLPILSGSAATLQLPLVCFKTRNIYSFFFMPLQKANPTGKSVSPQQVPDFLSLPSWIVIYFPIIEYHRFSENTQE